MPRGVVGRRLTCSASRCLSSLVRTAAKSVASPRGTPTSPLTPESSKRFTWRPSEALMAASPLPVNSVGGTGGADGRRGGGGHDPGHQGAGFGAVRPTWAPQTYRPIRLLLSGCIATDRRSIRDGVVRGGERSSGGHPASGDPAAARDLVARWRQLRGGHLSRDLCGSAAAGPTRPTRFALSLTTPSGRQ
jgi:hypothetical protein